MKKSLIEEPTIKLLKLFGEINQEAAIETNSTIINRLLFWWTRKPLIVGRAVALASTLDNIEDVRSLLQLNREKRAYTYSPDVGVYKKKLGQDPSEIKVLDPFGGAGNLMLPVAELGLDCTCSDYNPVAYLLEKAVLEHPTKYGTKLAEDFEKYAKQVIEMTEKEVGQFYNKNDMVYLWVWCIKCPHCSQRVPLTNQMWITKTTNDRIGVRFHVTDDKNFTTELVLNMSTEEGNKYTQKKGKAICISCKNTIDYQTLCNDIATRKDEELIAIQIQNNRKRECVLAKEKDKKLFNNAKKYLRLKFNEFKKMGLIPEQKILTDPRNPLNNYGVTEWNQFFSNRQLSVLTTLLKNIISMCAKIPDREYAKVISLYLGCMLCKHVDANCYGTVYDPSTSKISNALTFRQPRLVFNHAELHPFIRVRGGLYNILDNIKKGIIFSASNKIPVEISNNSVTNYYNTPNKFHLIITDPPYADDVIYGELSQFFYVWIYPCLKDHFPELPKRIPLDEDFCVSVGRLGSKQLAIDFFEKGFNKSFVSMNQSLKDDGLLVVFFAHSSIESWNLLLESISNAKLRVVSSYAIHTESTSNVIAKGKTAFMSSIIVTCRKLTKEITAYFEDIIPQTEDNVKSMIDKIPAEKILTIPITDLLIMVYGKVLETCTQFTELKSYEKDFKPDFKTLIEASQDFIMRQLVTKLTGRNMNLIGPEMAFYLLVRIFHRGKMSSDDAKKLEKAFTIDIKKLEKDGMITDVSGVKNLIPLQEINLELKPEELDSSNLYQQLCYLAIICKTQGASKVKSILSRTGNLKVDELKKIVPLLIKSYRLQINKNQKLDDSEQKELKILETISDTWGGTKIEGTLDGFVEK